MSRHEEIRKLAESKLPEVVRERRIKAILLEAARDALSREGFPVSVTVGQNVITVHGVEVATPENADPANQLYEGLNVWLEVWRSGERIDLDPTDGRSDLDHFHWDKPHLLVVDPKGSITGPVDGIKFREDPGAHLLQTVVDNVDKQLQFRQWHSITEALVRLR